MWKQLIQEGVLISVVSGESMILLKATCIHIEIVPLHHLFCIRKIHFLYCWIYFFLLLKKVCFSNFFPRLIVNSTFYFLSYSLHVGSRFRRVLSASIYKSCAGWAGVGKVPHIFYMNYYFKEHDFLRTYSQIAIFESELSLKDFNQIIDCTSWFVEMVCQIEVLCLHI